MHGNGQSSIKYPGIPTTSDGAGAVVWVEIHISQGAGAFPITSSTTMAHGFHTAVVNGQPNIWGDLLEFFEPESEHSSCTVCEGFALAGGRVTYFTSGQGLILMKEELGNAWLEPELFRYGASSLLGDIERQLEHHVTGRYSAAHRHPQA